MVVFDLSEVKKVSVFLIDVGFFVFCLMGILFFFVIFSVVDLLLKLWSVLGVGFIKMRFLLVYNCVNLVFLDRNL